MRLFRRPVASVVLLALAACGGGDLLLPNEGQPASVDLVSGDRQTATILEAAADSLVVRVTDRFGSPVAGVEIAWSADGGGGVSPASTVTDADGRSAAQRVLGAEPGSYGTTAVATALPEDVVSFTTTAAAARLVLLTQPGATASSGATIAPQPVLQLQDPAGNPLARPSVAVTVQIASGDGTLRGTTTQTSDPSGTVTFSDLAIAGGPGSRTLIFAASGYAPATSTPVSLGVGAPASAAVAAGDGQTAAVATSVPTPPAVVVRDAGGTPVAGVGVKFAVASGGGSVTGADATTGADGIAAVGSWTLGGNTGANTLRATVQADGVSGSPVTFTATATPGPASAEKSTVSAAPGTIAASTGSVASAITIIVRDGRGNPLAGQTVTLTATGAGVTLAQPGVTDASGVTTSRFSATGSGDHVISAVTAGVALGSATVKVTPGAPVASSTSVEVPGGTAGIQTIIRVRLQDQFGNAVGGAAGQVVVSMSGANPVGGVAVADQGDGTYLAGYTPARVGIDLVDVRVGGQPIPGSPFTSTVVAGAADPGHSTAEVPDGTFGTPLAILVHVNDSQGNSVGREGDLVQVTVDGISNGSLPVEYVGDGTYRAGWTPLVIGTFKVQVALNGTAIAKSPFQTHIRFFR
jgi:hypothetical protein